MKICILVTGLPPEFVGGTEFQTYGLASRLAKKHDVTVLTRAVKGRPGESHENGFQVRRFGFINFPVLRFISHIFSAVNELRKIRNQTDAVVCMMLSPNGLAGIIARKLFGIRTVSFIRGTDWNEAGFIGGIIAGMVVRNSDMTLAQTERTRKEVVSKYPGARTDVLHNGIKMGSAKASGKGVIFVGSLREVKGVGYLIKAMDDIDSDLVIIGDGPLRGELEELARGKRITFKGRLDKNDVISQMKKAGVLVLPSLSEGLPNVVLEAMSMGLPVVATKTGGIPDVVVDGKTGFLVEPRNPNAISDSVNRILKNDELGRKMKAASLAEIKKYSWESTVSIMEKILRRITGKNTDNRADL